MLCYVVMLFYGIVSCVILYVVCCILYAICHVMSYVCHMYVMCAVTCYVICYIICYVVSRRVVSCRVVSCRVVSCRVVSRRVVSCHMLFTCKANCLSHSFMALPSSCCTVKKFSKSRSLMIDLTWSCPSKNPLLLGRGISSVFDQKQQYFVEVHITCFYSKYFTRTFSRVFVYRVVSVKAPALK